jgi:hypothetical protein
MNEQDRLESLGLHAMVAHYDEIVDADWLPWLLEKEEQERRIQSLAG